MSVSPTPRPEPRGFFGVRPRFGFWVGAVVLLALLIREYFVLVTVVDFPIRGDILEYVSYAWNLYHHGVFSMATPQMAAPLPDAYRSPGYPWLLTLCMLLRPQGNGWYVLALQVQVILGTATVWLTMLLARRWLSLGWAIAAGLLLALWPHHVAATGALLSEVAFGFTLIAGLYCFAVAMEGRRDALFIPAALVFGYSYLINPLIALFPLLLGWLIWREAKRKAALLFIGIFLMPLLALGLRNLQIGNGQIPHNDRAGRAIANFVQGSWPQYHQAWVAQRLGDPIGTSIMKQIEHETTLLNEESAAGVTVITERMLRDPAYYASWYFWRKPALLWSWDLLIGRGGIYFLDVRNSPLDTHPLLRWSTTTLRVLNPLLTLLAFCGMMVVLVAGVRRKPWAPAAALATAALAFYLTAVHTVLQAEPRYAIAYRGIEIVLVMTLLKVLSDATLQRMATARAHANVAT